MARTVAAAKRVSVSLPEDLAALVEGAAEREDRSVSGQIVNIVRQWAEHRRRSVLVSEKEFDALVADMRSAANRSDRRLPPTLEQLIARSHVG